MLKNKSKDQISVFGSTLPLVSSVTNVEYTEAAEDDAINR